MDLTISGPNSGVRGQPLEFTGRFDGQNTDQTSGVTWQFGDGTTIHFHSASDPGALDVSHSFNRAGTYTVTLTVTFDGGGTLTTSWRVKINAVEVEADPDHPGLTDLVVGGSVGSDAIAFLAGPQPGGVILTLNGQTLGSFRPTGWLVGHGQGGNDVIAVSHALTLPAELVGGDGNDVLSGGGGNNILVGGAGNNILIGGKGRDLLIGGSGTDVLVAGPGGEILIAGTTAYDANDRALRALSAEYSRTDSGYLDRFNDLTSGGGLNGSYVLNSQTVFAGAAATLIGSSGDDLFYLDVAGDLLLDRRSGEIAANVSKRMPGS
jgi:PKD repeat protein